MFVIYVLLWVALTVHAALSNHGLCRVGPWQEWGRCMGDRACSASTMHHISHSYIASPNENDKKEETMKGLMEEKHNLWSGIEECLQDSTCPGYHGQPTSGEYPCVDGNSDGYPCLNIHQLAFLNFQDLGYTERAPGELMKRSSDMWGWHDPANNDEYAIVTVSGGTSFVRVTDPRNPEVLAFMYTQTVADYWHDVKVVGDFAFIVSEAKDHGMQVFNMSRLRGKAAEDFQVVLPDSHYGEVGNSHNIVANEDTQYVYIVGATDTNYPNRCNGGLHMVDVSDPVNPRFSGCFADDGYVHDAQCVIYTGPDNRYNDHEICFCYNTDSFVIVDVTDKDAHPVMLSKTAYEGAAYTHQGWLTDDMTVVFLNDEQDEKRSDDKLTRTYVWDITNLVEPVLESTYLSTETACDHNLYVRGDYQFQSNYQAGLRILHWDNKSRQLSETGYFDVFPPSTLPVFTGTWSNYPYFKDGVVGVTSTDFGFFLLQPDYGAMDKLADMEEKPAYEKRRREIDATDDGIKCPNLEQTRRCEPLCKNKQEHE